MTTRQPYRGQHPWNLRERVILEEYTTDGDDGFGNPIEVWVPHEPVAARVEPLKGEEKVIAGGLANPFDVLVHIRYRPDVAATWRVVHDGQTLNIVSLRNLDERKRFLTLECRGGA